MKNEYLSNKAVLDALGIETKNVTRVVIILNVGELPRVHITKLLPDNRTKVVQKFDLVPRP
jgi:hypothetical protein